MTTKLQKEWETVKSTILGKFNAGQIEYLNQNGSTLFTADQQREMGRLRDAEIVADEVAKFFLSKINN